ncbi:LLM class flavin-dependent oxidoreductase [Pseudomonas typographi]|uniref:LLM class flavin-dependent oxidoreductase n=1 Tax=Pseudomonas typographi TaxID=2715964 RepID=A0ABR7Z304_9PSED|nr:LLM class flavin-dependent oxidoreductase [Pseudomonas typographi]MBD1553131.1 LLM class flavin-dependent oxidoreductase [Pseudomonas typographi]MBD1585882.1 LLM class flavin-dependent oxidoreductase [Pseudomonas typographi]MBD1599752.1 LLM class flavin-dependent oxidoreductase [Pseudomonas typographi]
MSTRKHMHLMLQIGIIGNHHAAWRHKNSRIKELHSLSLHADTARWAEQACLDSIFQADVIGRWGGATYAPDDHLEALTLLSALSAVTDKIGLIGTVSTSFSHPFNLARQFASLDHLSNGRAGWNIVTSAYGEKNFGVDELPHHDVRYARAAEFVEAASQLWNSWETDAIVADTQTGIYADESKIHRIDFNGPHFQIQGPLNLPRSPQGRPVFVQAGSSEQGRDLAARFAEVIFTAQPSLKEAQAFYRDIKQRAVAHGRHADSIKVLVGLNAIVADTDQAAEQVRQGLAEGIHEGNGRLLLSAILGEIDLSGLPLDEPLPADIFREEKDINRRQSRFGVFKRLALEDRLTLRQLMEIEALAAGHWVATGSGKTVARQMIEYFDQQAADGFVFLPSHVPEGVTSVLQSVVPELQKAGYFRTAYEASTLRGHLGLAPLAG